MSANQHDRFGEIHALVHAVLGNRATDEERERLERLVVDDEQARKIYVQYMHETVTIEGLVQGAADPRSQSGAASRFAALAAPRLRSRVSFRRHWPVFAAAAAGVLAGVILLGFWPGSRSPAQAERHGVPALPVASRPTSATASGSERPRTVVRPQRVAKIVRSVKAHWQHDGNPVPLEAGDWLDGGRYLLETGLARIVFPWGTEVTLEGPTEIEFSPEGTRRLLYGQVVAKVSPEDTDFTIDTDAVEVIDLGTEFGLSAWENGGAEVHVFKGAVEARQKLGDLASLAGPIKLSAGEATGFGMSDVPVRPIVFNPKRYSRAWRVASRVADTNGALRFVHPPPASVVEGATESSEHLILFLEGEAIRLSEPTAVTFTEPALYTAFAGRTAVIAEGRDVDSYLVHFDPLGSKVDQTPLTVEGSVTFDRPIVGVIARGDQLAASDHVLAYPGTQYAPFSTLERAAGIPEYQVNRQPPYYLRGMGGLWSAFAPRESPAPNDMVRLSSDRRTLTVRSTAGGEANQLRVLVSADDDELPLEREIPRLRQSQPYRGRPFAVGENIEAEDFDTGGEGVAYYDNTPDSLANVYRPNESVELYCCKHDDREHLAVCLTRAGEWLIYTVEIDEPGECRIQARVASGPGNGVFRVEFDDAVSTEPMRIPPTKQKGYLIEGYDTIESSPIRLEAGRHSMRVLMEQNHSNGWVGDFDWFRLVR